MLAADGIGVILGGLVFGLIWRKVTPYRATLVALILLLTSLVVLGALLPVPFSVMALALTGFGFGIMVPNNQTIFRRITDLEYRGRLLGLRDAVVGVSSPAMVIIVGLALDQMNTRLVLYLLALINLGVLAWYLQESLFARLKTLEPAPELAPQGQ